ncbi:unnamed protein product [Acanthoscelides obtectus]|uniref:Uncharacterized protein n=1 Tax=Acanthoscelides obtectus TaxID=200917 RepID=A0A9P0Q0R9_ACAOB|nr:unnamed protein product [Acanthoscelides obtectus]CAK1656478.1 hypothetical protein AOBTE_LOCUS19733 [Acanthoscelides obtectus]
MSIKCKTEEPVIYNPYHMSIQEKNILNDLLQELLINGIVRESSSQYASLVKKKTAASAGVAENKWDTFVKPVQYAMNTTFNAAIGMTAMELLAGFKVHSLSEGNVLSAVKREVER